MKISDIKREMKKYPLFYRKVWLKCMEIPFGQTRSYKWIAKEIGRPKAFRAVALALKRNPFAPYVPCHRVIRSDGTIGGYSALGGAEKKREMIIKEKELAKRNKKKSF
ncbi:MAG: methylated-DNA--[protein]-cysteine S-methyltransferase [Elusimicrobiales bacterium]